LIRIPPAKLSITHKFCSLLITTVLGENSIVGIACDSLPGISLAAKRCSMHAAEKSWRQHQIFAVYSFHTNQFMFGALASFGRLDRISAFHMWTSDNRGRRVIRL
jgi:hypothetical protein